MKIIANRLVRLECKDCHWSVTVDKLEEVNEATFHLDKYDQVVGDYPNQRHRIDTTEFTRYTAKW